MKITIGLNAASSAIARRSVLGLFITLIVSTSFAAAPVSSPATKLVPSQQPQQTQAAATAQQGAATPTWQPSLPAPILEKILKQGTPKEAFYKTLQFMESNPKLVGNRRYVALVDFSKSIKKKRLFIVNLKSGEVGKFFVTHGQGSDPERTGVATKFSNVEGSKASSLGFYLTKSQYDGMFGVSLRLKGLSKSNSQAESRAVVMHPYYVGPGYEHYYTPDYREKCVNGGCLTQGCFGVPHAVAEILIEHLRGGAIIYAFK